MAHKDGTECLVSRRAMPGIPGLSLEIAWIDRPSRQRALNSELASKSLTQDLSQFVPVVVFRAVCLF
jgi:hypothetical protein